MAVEVAKIDSNVTGLRYAEEDPGNSLGPLEHLPRAAADPPTDNYGIWEPLEPNSYADFGGQIATVARNPINPSRQRKKGVTTDLDASGGFNTDWTQTNLQDMLQGLMFADFRRKGDFIDGLHVREGSGGYGTLIDATVTTDIFQLANFYVATVAVTAGGTGYAVGDIVELDPVGTSKAQARVTAVASGVVTALAVYKHGAYTADPTGSGIATTALTGAGNDDLTVSVTDGSFAAFAANDLVYTQGFVNAGNNGLHVVTNWTAPSLAATGSTLVNETAPAGATLVRVGAQGTAGDLDVVAPGGGTLPTITSAAAVNFVSLGIVPGDWIFVGGDTAQTQFATAANNGWKRVRSVTSTVLTIDKSDQAMVAEASTTETVQIFVGRTLRNETGTLIKRRSYTLERTLGVPNPAAAPTEVQAEYLRGSVPNELSVNIPSADKVNLDLSFVSTKHYPKAASVGLWSEHASASAPALVEADAFNTSSDFSRIKLATVPDTPNEAPDPLFAYATELSLSVNNNVTPNKAVGVLGAFDVTAGTFEVGGNMTVYFADIAAIQSVQNNADITLDIVIAKANAAIAIDVPLITLGDGRANIEQDQAITLPLETLAATGAKVDPGLDHTLLLNFFDYVPDAAL